MWLDVSFDYIIGAVSTYFELGYGCEAAFACLLPAVGFFHALLSRV